METMLEQARAEPHKMPSVIAERCIDWMCEVWQDERLHEGAREGYWRVGQKNALDGSQDHLIVREAQDFWQSLGMPRERARECQIVEEEFRAGRLRWDIDGVYSLVEAFPKTGILDTTVEHQDDEVVVPSDGEAPDATTDEESQEDQDTDSGADDGGHEEGDDEARDPDDRVGGRVMDTDQASAFADHTAKVQEMESCIASMERQGLDNLAMGSKDTQPAEAASGSTGRTEAQKGS